MGHITSVEIRKRFLDFFQKRGHVVIPSSSLVPENDPSVLFNTAGMQPIMPYLMGSPHPKGHKLVDIQKCIRTTDIDDVGDNTHLTFFEMMGNWSLGSYFKVEAIKWSFELLTSKTEGFGLDPGRLYITVFAGDKNAPKDEESADIWHSVGVPKNRIYFKDASANWWPAVKGTDSWSGPTGPCSEMFYDVTSEGLGDLTPLEYDKADKEQKMVEIWNDVFMEYEKKDGKIIGKLKQKNVDTGAGFERLCAVLQGKDNVFDIDIFKPIVDQIKNNSNSSNLKRTRIIADHIRSATFMIADGVRPSNTDRGYILRRLIRRAKYHYNSIGGENKALGALCHFVIDSYKNTDYVFNENEIDKIITDEEGKFSTSLLFGQKYLEKIIKESGKVSGEDVFLLYSTYGYPFELTKELALENGITIDEKDFQDKVKKHQELSRTGAKQKFKAVLE